MNSNPAWQGAAQVASARLKTIDEALAKLEAVVSNDENSNSTEQTPDNTANPAEDSSPNVTNHLETEIRAEAGLQLSSIPPASLQALETFLAGA